MTRTRWETVKSLFFDAIALGEMEREVFLRHLASMDEEVSDQLRALLADADDSGPDLRQPCWTCSVNPSASLEAKPERTFESGELLIDRFEICDFLGSGGLGEVYRAFDRHRGQTVAVKTLRPGMTADPGALSLLRHELNTALAVTHPNVCRVFDIHFSPAPGSPLFFSMELLEGETLAASLVREGPFPFARFHHLVPQILEGLTAIHEKGIVHRDLKTGNVMVTDGGTRVVLLDFGLARNLKESGDLATTLASSEFAGTPAYMAPELLRGKAATVVSDVYALGVVFFELITGRRPFEGSTPVEAAAKRLHERAPSPRLFVSTIDRRWEYIITQCLQSEPSRRPQTVADVRRLIERVPPLLFGNRRRFLVGSAMTLAAGAAAVTFRPPRSEPRRLASIAICDLANGTGDPTLDALPSGVTQEIGGRLSGINRREVIRIHGSRVPVNLSAGVKLSLEGELTGTRERLRWDLRLREQPSGAVKWTRMIAQEPGLDIVTAQNRVANVVTAQLVQIQGFSERDNRAQSQAGLALDFYMRGRTLLEDPSPDGAKTAIQYLKRSIEVDPAFALAWSALADANLALLAYATANSQLIMDAKEAANRAIVLDPGLAEAHAALGAIHQQELDWEGSERSYREAMRLKPVFPRLHRWYAGFVLQFGRFEEVVEHSRLALQQDPFDQMGPMAIGFYYLFSDRPKDAINLMEPFVEGRYLDATRYNLGQAYARMAQKTAESARTEWLKKAIGQAQQVKAIEERKKTERPWIADRLFALAHTIAGNRQAASEFIARLHEDVDSGRIVPADIAWTYAIERDYGTAISLLERTYAEVPSGLAYIKVNPFLENLKGQPRFEHLVQALRL